MTPTIHLALLDKNDIEEIVQAFYNLGWNKPKKLYDTYFNEQLQGIRTIFVAKANGNFCGYVTIKWKADHSFFKDTGMPEISDLNVLPYYRNQGVGTTLIKFCEKSAKERGFDSIGLGVGLTSDYGAAQKLYINLGYIPDGFGLFYRNSPVSYGSQIVADDELVIYLFKKI